MGKLWKKIFLLVLCLLMTMPFMTPVSAENDDVETIHSTFFVLTTRKNRTMPVQYSGSWFMQDADQYNHNIARLSLGLATSAFRPNIRDVEKGMQTDSNLSRFLTEAHFTDLRSDDYDKNPGMYTVSTVMGHQKIGEGEDAFELIAVGVCGQGYMDEWTSNFSIGNGTVHDGFSRSSNLIYDRIFGYIASRHLTGKMKVWIAGFSRAAAVSNLTAARLSESGVFDQKSVFAYTFATPRTVMDKDYGRYKNIFNIVGKTDPVPAVPFADWGYERYGQTLYLPVPETDSDYEQKRVRANEIYRNLTGIDYWYNKNADVMLKDILTYLLKICPTVDIYASEMQEKLIHIWENREPVSILSSVLDLANDPVLINEDTRESANMLLNYLLLALYDYNSSVFRNWNSKASLGANILQAHTPELYVSWLFSEDDPMALYSTTEEYTILYVESPGDVRLIDARGELVETIPYVSANIDGRPVVIVPKDERETPEGNIYLDYVENEIRVVVPKDEGHVVEITSEHDDSSVLIMAEDFAASKQNPERMTLHEYTVRKGETVRWAFYPDGTVELTTDIEFDPDKYFTIDMGNDVNELIRMTRYTVYSHDWRSLVLILLRVLIFVIALILFQITYVIGKVRFTRRVRKGWLPEGTKFRALPILCTFAIFYIFLVMQFHEALLPDDAETLLKFKSLISLLAIFIAAGGYWRRKTALSGHILGGVTMLSVADILMTTNMYAGSAFHIGAYLLLSWSYFREEKPMKRQLFLWFIMSAIGILFLSAIRGEYRILRIIAMVYLVSALLMVTLSFAMPRRVFYGSILLFISGILLMNNTINGVTFTTHLLSLGVYYMAIAALASSNTMIIMPRLVPEGFDMTEEHDDAREMLEAAETEETVVAEETEAAEETAEPEERKNEE